MPFPRPTSAAPLLFLLACACTTHRTAEEILRDPNTRIVHSGFDQFSDKGAMREDVHDANSLKRRREEAALRRLDAANGWGISLAAFTGMDRLAQARRLADEQGIEGAVISERDGTADLFVGRFERPDDEKAVREVRRWQAVEKERAHPFGAAMLRPLPAAAGPDDEDPADARRYAGCKTLLVGFYNEEFGRKWREEAKRVAKLLRKEGPGDGQGGVEAFWRVDEERKEASVRVGLFTVHDDWVKKRTADKRDPNLYFFTEAPGPAVDALLERFPCLLLNGKKVRKPSDGLGSEEYEKPAVTDL